MDDSTIFITGVTGQLGKALQSKYPGAKYASTNEMDITKSESVTNYDWSRIKYILNAAAYTDVDSAETPEGRVAAWKANASAVTNLAQTAQKNDLTLVHISSDYVFDGSKESHAEDEPFSPLSVYGQSKAAGDIAASLAPKHYILRASWMVGDGPNFVKTMIAIGQKGIAPTVVSDQIGRLTFTDELVNILDYLLTNNSAYGTYNASNSGDPVSWADIAREIFNYGGFNLNVNNIPTEDYFAGKTGIAPRPLQSTLMLDKLQAAGYSPTDWRDDLKTYVAKEANS